MTEEVIRWKFNFLCKITLSARSIVLRFAGVSFGLVVRLYNWRKESADGIWETDPYPRKRGLSQLTKSLKNFTDQTFLL